MLPHVQRHVGIVAGYTFKAIAWNLYMMVSAVTAAPLAVLLSLYTRALCARMQARIPRRALRTAMVELIFRCLQVHHSTELSHYGHSCKPLSSRVNQPHDQTLQGTQEEVSTV
jgi:hypothetical protein